jgi:hypothetical protein
VHQSGPYARPWAEAQVQADGHWREGRVTVRHGAKTVASFKVRVGESSGWPLPLRYRRHAATLTFAFASEDSAVANGTAQVRFTPVARSKYNPRDLYQVSDWLA